MKLTDDLFVRVAARFKALGEPARLRILDAVRSGESTVGELKDRTGLNQANLSKHLQLLHALEFVTRRKEGLFVYYSLASFDVFVLCDIMCGQAVTRTKPSTVKSAKARRPSYRAPSARHSGPNDPQAPPLQRTKSKLLSPRSRPK